MSTITVPWRECTHFRSSSTVSPHHCQTAPVQEPSARRTETVAGWRSTPVHTHREPNTHVASHPAPPSPETPLPPFRGNLRRELSYAQVQSGAESFHSHQPLHWSGNHNFSDEDEPSTRYLHGAALAISSRHENANCGHGSEQRLFDESTVWNTRTRVSFGLSAFHTVFLVRGVRQRSIARHLEGSLLQHQVRNLCSISVFTHR